MKSHQKGKFDWGEFGSFGLFLILIIGVIMICFSGCREANKCHSALHAVAMVVLWIFVIGAAAIGYIIWKEDLKKPRDFF